MPVQPDLFAANDAPAAPQDLVRISGPAATLSKTQKDFNRLIDRIAGLRAHLAQWLHYPLGNAQ